MENMGLVSKEQLIQLDSIIYDPKSAPLVARNLFTSYQVPPEQDFYKYRVRHSVMEAKEYTNRMTDIPQVEEGITEYTVPLTESILAASFTKSEVEKARVTGIDLVSDQGRLVAQGLSEREDKIIFNGLESKGIVGLTNTDVEKTGFQQINAEQTFAELQADTEEGALKLRNFFKEAVGKITHLVGYANAKPTLLLPQAEIDELERPFNKYNPDKTVRQMIEPWLSEIVAVPELEGKYWHAKNSHLADRNKDMGILCLTDPEIAQIPDAYPISRQPTEYSKLVTTVPYMEKHGGLAVRYPSAFVQLMNIN
ncbi:MAG: hypothetical protein [Bacteriophage sp.]|nr:MAG: hypothetical protein [Bacteriophage sp.]